MARITEQDRAEARERLLKIIAPGDTIYCTLKHVSRSGMSRVIDFRHIVCDGKREPSISWISYNVALACGYRYDNDREAVKVLGAGMDMGFAVVYDLGRVLFPDGFDCMGERCHGNDHQPRGEAVKRHRDGGYALRHRWL